MLAPLASPTPKTMMLKDYVNKQFEVRLRVGFLCSLLLGLALFFKSAGYELAPSLLGPLLAKSIAR